MGDDKTMFGDNIMFATMPDDEIFCRRSDDEYFKFVFPSLKGTECGPRMAGKGFNPCSIPNYTKHLATLLARVMVHVPSHEAFSHTLYQE